MRTRVVSLEEMEAHRAPDEVTSLLLSFESLLPIPGKPLEGVISTEGFLETARAIWEKIVAMVKALWGHIAKLYQVIFGRADNLLERATKGMTLVTELKAKTNAARNQQTTLGHSVVQALCVSQQAITSQSIGYALESLGSGWDYLLHKYHTYLLSMMQAAEKGADVFNPDRPEECVKFFKSALHAIALPAITGDSASHGVILLPGLHKLAVHDRDQTEALMKLESAEGKKPDGGVAIKTYSLYELEKYYMAVVKFEKVIQQYYKRGFPILEEAQKTFAKKCANMTKNLNKIEAPTERHTDALAAFQDIAKYNIKFAQWVKSPIAEYATLCNTTMTAILDTLDMMLAEYKPHALEKGAKPVAA